MNKYMKTICITGALTSTIASTNVSALNCDVYASEAVGHQQLNESLKCGFTGDRWHTNSGGHHLWCTFTNDRQRQAHHDYRIQKISECKLVVLPGKVQVVPAPKTSGPVAKGIDGAWCNDWAYNQADLAKHYENQGCKLAGDQSQNAHYNFCMTSPRNSINAKPGALMQEGNACLNGKSSAVSPNPPSAANPPSSSNSADALYNHCVAYTQEAWAVTSNALDICRNALSVPTSEAGIHNECMEITFKNTDLANIQGFTAGRMGLLRNLMNICDRK